MVKWEKLNLLREKVQVEQQIMQQEEIDIQVI